MKNDTDTIKSLISLCVYRAKQTGKRHFLSWDIESMCWTVTDEYQRAWQFYAYPGGRTVMSQELANILGVPK